ncbi:hypothetical protein [Paraburkholderia pallida]|uniref:Uncharacterized protein n=1 Tax=Paraburkholderia pallida TaxID=2547399 RepID=A0A4P7D111_9BURK|nr:hypothetical protein [Paraburkholderia pallida]QBR00094.1 hypothetical protein E1956_23685 [Paraburkholderia pallida]
MANAGIGIESDTMKAAIIGGTSFSGRIGAPIGMLAGAFIIGRICHAFDCCDLAALPYLLAPWAQRVPA